jgi:hypothetical protein
MKMQEKETPSEPLGKYQKAGPSQSIQEHHVQLTLMKKSLLAMYILCG